MTWTRDTSNGRFTHSGVARSVWMPTGVQAPTSGRVSLQCRTYTHNIRCVCPCSTDGRTGWEVGIMSDGFASQANLTIRRISMGVPSFPTQQIAHGLSASVPFTLQVDYTDNTITASILGPSSAVTLSHTNTTEPTYTTFRSVAFGSDVDGAIVDSAQVCELVRDFATIRDALVAVADDGSVYASYDGTSMTPVSTRVLGQSGVVSLDQYLGTVYGVGGGKARKIDLVNRMSLPWNPTSGSLPGANGAGTTDAQGVVFWGTRAVLFRSQSNPNGLYFSAIDDPDDFNTGSAIFGAAYARNMPEPVVSVVPLTDRQLLVCCERSTFVILGDPGLGSSETLPILGSTGASGPTAAVPGLTPGGAMIHSPEGVYTVSGQLAVPLTKQVLSLYAEINRDDIGTYTVTAVRDPANARIHIFITPTSSASQGTHLCYEEVVGGYQAGGAGWFLDTMPADFGPTAACVHRGRIYFGGHDGIIRAFSVDAEDDDGEDIDVRLPVRVILTGATEGDVRLDRVAPQMTADSEAVTVTLYGAPTAEMVMDPDQRSELWETTYTHLQAPITRRGSDSALMLVFSGTSATWAIEQVDIVASPLARSRRRVRTAVTAGAPCTYPDAPTTPPAGPGGGTGPGPSGGSSGPVDIDPDEDVDGGRSFERSPLAKPIDEMEFDFVAPIDDSDGGGDNGGGQHPMGDPLGSGDETTNGFGGVGIDRDGFGVQVRFYPNGDFSYGFDYTPPPNTE